MGRTQLTPDHPAVRIVNLADARDYAPELADWYVAEWSPWYGVGGNGDAAADLAASSKSAPPICLIAIGDDGALLGAASLKPDDVGNAVAPGPWLGALVTHSQARGRGIARALIDAIEDLARDLGYPAIYTSTDGSAAALHAKGWVAIGVVPSLRGQVAVYRKTLADSGIAASD